VTSKKNKPFPAKSNIITAGYRGPDRREPDADQDPGKPTGNVSFNETGNPVWQMRAEVPRRRQDDDTIDMLKCLDLDSLSLEDEDSLPGEEDTEPTDGYDPYNR